jgi:hypothetical protein
MTTQAQFRAEEAAMADSRKQQRESRRSARDAKDRVKDALQGVTSTMDRREIKQSGGIYDVSTRSYKPKKPNPQTGKKNIQDDGIDFPERDVPDEEEGGIDFNGSLRICRNGEPYWIDISFDKDVGAYSGSQNPNFPINP